MKTSSAEASEASQRRRPWLLALYCVIFLPGALLLAVSSAAAAAGWFAVPEVPRWAAAVQAVVASVDVVVLVSLWRMKRRAAVANALVVATLVGLNVAIGYTDPRLFVWPVGLAMLPFFFLRSMR